MISRDLGELELFTLLAIHRLGGDATGLAIRDEIRRRTGRAVSVGSGYATLGRLTDKGLLRVRIEPARPQQGGRARKHVQLTAAGVRLLRESVQSLHNMLDGIVPGTSS
jgi:PadR family transcriptional regulator PadR